MMKDSIGIDVSKDHLDVHCLGDGRAARFGNDAAGFRKLKAWLPKADNIARVVYEATGPYHAALERRFGGDLPLVKVNPLQRAGLRNRRGRAPRPTRWMRGCWRRWGRR